MRWLTSSWGGLAGLVLLAAVSACGSSQECPAGENRICDGIDNCLCGPRCSDDSDCLSNQTCAENISDERACVAIAFKAGAAPECASGQKATEALCGSDRCGCADPCGTHEDCRSLCCAEGFCALPCVCEGPDPVEVVFCGGS